MKVSKLALITVDDPEALASCKKIEVNDILNKQEKEKVKRCMKNTLFCHLFLGIPFYGFTAFQKMKVA